MRCQINFSSKFVTKLWKRLNSITFLQRYLTLQIAVGSSAKILSTNLAEGLIDLTLYNSSSLSNVIKFTPALVANLCKEVQLDTGFIHLSNYLRWDACLHGFAYMIFDGSTPRSSILRISLLLAQSNPVPNAARVCSNKGSSLHFTAIHTKVTILNLYTNISFLP